MNIIIRESNNDDFISLSSLYQKSAPKGTGSISVQVDYSAEYLKNVWRMYGDLLLFDLVAVKDQEIIGHISAFRIPGETDSVHVGNWVVDQKYQGPIISFRLGYELYKKICEKGYKKIYYQTLVADNRPAKIYRALGAIPSLKKSIQMGLNMLVDYAPMIIAEDFYLKYFENCENYRESWIDEARESVLMKSNDKDVFICWQNGNAFIGANQIFPFKFEREGKTLKGGIDLLREKYNYVNFGDYIIILKLSKNIVTFGDKLELKLMIKNKKSAELPINLTMKILKNESVQINQIVKDNFELTKQVEIGSDMLDIDYADFDCLLTVEDCEIDLGVSAQIIKPFTVEKKRFYHLDTAEKEIDLIFVIKNNVSYHTKGIIEICLDQQTYSTEFLLQANEIAEISLKIPEINFSGIKKIDYTIYFNKDDTYVVDRGISILCTKNRFALVFAEIDDQLIFVNDYYWLIFDKKIGSFDVNLNDGVKMLKHYFNLNKINFELNDYTISEKNGIINLILQYKNKADYIKQSFIISSNPIIIEKWEIVSDKVYQLESQLDNYWLGGQIHLRSNRYFPIVDTDYTFPRFVQPFTLADAIFTEKWIGYSNKDISMGIVWEQTIDNVSFTSNLPKLKFTLNKNYAQKFYLVCGKIPISFIESLAKDVHTNKKICKNENNPVLVSNSSSQIDLRSNIKLPLDHSLEDYSLEVNMPDKWAISPNKLINKNIDSELQVEVSTTEQAVARYGEVKFKNCLTEHNNTLALLQVQDQNYNIETMTMEKNETEVLSIFNGKLGFDIAPQFSGSLYSLKYDQKDLMCSNFMIDQETLMFKEWVGGVYPTISKFFTNTESTHFGFDLREAIKNPFTWKQVKYQNNNLLWTGYKISGYSDRIGYPLELDIEYLTLPYSNIIGIVSRYRNPTNSNVFFNGIVNFFFQINKDLKMCRLLYPQKEKLRTRERSKYCGRIISEGWSGIEEKETKRFVMVVSENGYLIGNDFGYDGIHLARERGIYIPPKNEVKIIDYLIVGHDLKANLAYKELMGKNIIFTEEE